ncbi:MAG: CDP-diacylglycerol--serine O-phosphatidyltransferase [Bacteroidetes bacterium]|nr:CDP-diacylglycerol--serine O-phosphatidyltransferase [Bacteroidota bacterium]
MRIRLSRSIVPNLFTVLNIFFGFLSIIHAVQELYVQAVWYVILSAACDALDGVMARLTNSASAFGVELDSLADVVGFGVAPSFLLYSLILHTYGTFGILIAAVPLILGALRLARFNVQLVGFSKDHFTGMPIPLSALTLVSFVLFFRPEDIIALPQLQYGLIVLTLACGGLMISTVRYPVIPKISIASFRRQPVQMTLLVAGVIAVIASRGMLLFPLLLAVDISGPLFATGRKLRHAASRRGGTAEKQESDALAGEKSISIDSPSSQR